ncbi:MAG: peptidase S10 [Gammaproteobacteria bacterium]|jgi:carboxypeptidase C (cathepsin A)
MKRTTLHLTLFLASLLALPAFAADKPPAQAKAPTARKSVTHGSVTVAGHRIRYDATAGTIILKNKDEKPIASMSYVAYTKSGVEDPSTRPITFFYNGGPGSSTIWLHMLAFGPKIVHVGNGELTPPAPYKMTNNDDSLLDATDMVFIDAPGTGFGRVITKDHGGAGKPENVYGIDEDAHAFAQFITRYITENSRWNSPKFLFGESYGTTRSAVLSNILESEKSVGLNGVVLLSSILNWSTSVDFPEANPGSNLPYELGLPTYAATAYSHHKLPSQPKALEPFLKEVEQFAMGDYARALDRGDQLDPATRQQIAEKMHQYTGLPVAYVLKADLKVDGGQFAHELLNDENRVTGRLDSRYSGPTMDPLGESADYDPMNSAIGPPTVAEFNDYIRNTLNFGKDMTYKPMINVFPKWNFKHKPPGAPFQLPFTPNVMPDLSAAMKHNPHMKVMLAGGYFDLGTTFYSAQFQMHQLGLPADLQKNISYDFFPSGHMVYLDPASRKGLHDAAASFIESNYSK